MQKQTSSSRTAAAPPKWSVDAATPQDAEKQDENDSNNSQQNPVQVDNGTISTSEPAAIHAKEVPDDDHKREEAFAEAQAAWDEVETVVPEYDTQEGHRKASPGSGAVSGQSPKMTFREAYQFLQNSDMEQYKSVIKTSVERRGFSAFTHLLFGPPKLHRDLHQERDLAFSIAACPLDNGEAVHIEMLQTIYKKLTGAKFDCQRYGSHWEEIGFQGNDPSTDLRGCGLLGLLHLVYLVMEPRLLQLSREIYKLSLHHVQNFPLCVMSINITRLAIQALREDCLNKEMNKRKLVMDVLNEFYVGAFLHLYQIWKTQQKTIADSGYVLKEVESFSKKKPQQVMRNLELHLAQKNSAPKAVQAAASGGGKEKSQDAQLTFSGVCDLDPDK